jgi:hypothetical protein
MGESYIHRLIDCTLSPDEIGPDRRCSCGEPALYHDGDKFNHEANGWLCHLCYIANRLVEG